MAAGDRSSSTHRVFFALDLPPALRAGLAAWSERAAASDPGLRTVAPARLHVTLLYLGEVPGAAIARLGARLLEIEPRRIALAAGAIVGVPRRRPRLFAAELAAEGAAELRSELISRLEAAGLPHGDREQIERPFWPHVTLLRARRGAAPNLAAEGLELPSAVTSGAHDAVRVRLYRSNKSSGGSPGEAYEPLAGLELPSTTASGRSEPQPRGD